MLNKYPNREYILTFIYSFIKYFVHLDEMNLIKFEFFFFFSSSPPPFPSPLSSSLIIFSSILFIFLMVTFLVVGSVF